METGDGETFENPPPYLGRIVDAIVCDVCLRWCVLSEVRCHNLNVCCVCVCVCVCGCDFFKNSV